MIKIPLGWTHMYIHLSEISNINQAYANILWLVYKLLIARTMPMQIISTYVCISINFKTNDVLDQNFLLMLMLKYA